MKNLTLALLTAIMMLFAVPSLSAQNDILLGANIGTGRMQFSAKGGKGNFTLNICSKVMDGVCVLRGFSGPARGLVNGFYTFIGDGVTGILTSGKNCNICRWRLSGPPLYFELSSRPNDGGTDWLDGAFQLVTMTQTKNVDGVGFNQEAVVNWTILGGALAGLFSCPEQPAPCVVKLNLQFTTDKPLQRIPEGQSLVQRFSGTIN